MKFKVMKLKSGRKTFTGCAILIIFCWFLSCDKNQKINYKDQFNLARFKVEQFDLFNPMLNVFKIDAKSRKEHPGKYPYDVYVDSDGKVYFAYFDAHDYGYLMEFYYKEHKNLSKIIIHPVLADSIDNHGKRYINKFFYLDGHLKVYRDQLNDEIMIVDKESLCLIYKGILTSKVPFSIQEIKIRDYFINLLH